MESDRPTAEAIVIVSLPGEPGVRVLQDQDGYVQIYGTPQAAREAIRGRLFEHHARIIELGDEW